MLIPKALLTKHDNKNQFPEERTQRILEEGWSYLQNYFKDKKDYFDFLENLSKDRYKKFLYTIWFFWTHDLYRLIKKEEIKNSNIDGFMYQITLSIVEYLNKGISNSPRERIKDFFINRSRLESDLKNKIIARPLGGISLPCIENWEILYDMRNGFIHRAKWFVMREGGFAALSTVEKKDGSKYLADIRLQFREYLSLFWKAYLEYLGKNK